MFGAAALGGGEDDRTVLHALGWREGQREIPRDGQGPKLGGLDSKLLPVIALTSALGPPSALPQELPITYIELGKFEMSRTFSLGAFPAELSTAQAADIREVMGKNGRFEIIGLADEYASYVATADEYMAQDYMGASTLWGPLEGNAFKEAIHIASMRHLLVPPSVAVQRLRYPRKTYKVGPVPELSLSLQALGAAAIGDSLPSADDGFSDVLLDATGSPVRRLPRFDWDEMVVRPPSGDFAAMGRHVEMLTQSDDTWIVRRTPERDDDEGPGFMTVLRKAGRDGGRRWSALWLAPILESGLGGTFMFRVTVVSADGHKTQICSIPFDVMTDAALPPHTLASNPSNRCPRTAQ
jgi:hypothetical protein